MYVIQNMVSLIKLASLEFNIRAGVTPSKLQTISCQVFRYKVYFAF